ncbi:MAG: hypothetical protein OXJ64_07415 [Boseongicola sp.]|nr:hypothetical protein [Boseongicola sp.]
MPQSGTYEDANAVLSEHEIWATRHMANVEAVPKAKGTQGIPQGIDGSRLLPWSPIIIRERFS